MPESIKVLLDASQAAAKKHNFSSVHVLRGAATHTGAYLLQALEEQGWTLAPTETAELDRVADVEDQLRDERLEVERLRKALKSIASGQWNDQGVIAVAKTALERGEPVEPTSGGLTLFRAMGRAPEFDEPVDLGGLRHDRERAERDARQALTEGWVEAWVEEATWRRVLSVVNVEEGER